MHFCTRACVCVVCMMHVCMCVACECGSVCVRAHREVRRQFADSGSLPPLFWQTQVFRLAKNTLLFELSCLPCYKENVFELFRRALKTPCDQISFILISQLSAMFLVVSLSWATSNKNETAAGTGTWLSWWRACLLWRKPSFGP